MVRRADRGGEGGLIKKGEGGRGREMKVRVLRSDAKRRWPGYAA